MNKLFGRVRRQLAMSLALVVMLAGMPWYALDAYAEGGPRFNVYDNGGYSIEDASIIVKDVSGDEVSSYEPDQTYSYTVSKDGYETANGSFSGSEEEVSVTLTRIKEDRTAAFENSNSTIIVPFGTNTFSNPVVSEATVNYSSSDPTRVSVDENGVVTLNRANDTDLVSATITATIDSDNYMYNAFSKDYTIIFQAATSFDITNTEESYELGSTFSMTYNSSRQVNNSDIVYEDNSDFVTVNADGTVAISEQFDDIEKDNVQVTITAYVKASGDGQYLQSNPDTYSFNITRKEQNPPPLYKKNSNLYVGQEDTFNFEYDRTAFWGNESYKSSDESVATIDSSTGKVHAVAPGTVTLTARRGRDFIFREVTANLELTVLPVVSANDVMTVTGEKSSVSDNDGNFWYKGDVYLTAKEGYSLYTDSNMDKQNSLRIEPNKKVVEKFYAYDVVNDAYTDVLTSDVIYRDSVNPTISLSQPKTSKLYNDSFNISINCADELSGVYSLEYEISPENGETVSGNLSVLSTSSFTTTLRAPADIDTRYSITVTVTDFAGNQASETIDYRVNTVLPVISVSSGEGGYVRSDDSLRGYFDTEREAIITVWCDSECFDEETATQMLIRNALTICDISGDDISSDGVVIGNWIHEPDDVSSNNDKHTVTVKFTSDGNYTWSPSYTDKADNYTNIVNYEDSTTPRFFTIDRSEPTGKVSVAGKGEWTGLIDDAVYSLFLHAGDKVSAAGDDTMSPIYSLSYFIKADNGEFTDEDVESFETLEWLPFEESDVERLDHYIYYIRIEDYAGNVSYVSTDGLIFDNDAPAVSVGAANDVYNHDITVSVGVNELNKLGLGSGIASVTYSVSNGTSQTASGTLFTYTGSEDDLESLVQSYSGSVSISAKDNNTNDTVLTVTATDRAGNQASSSQKYRFDVTAPTVSVSYDNNSGDTSYGEFGFFNSARTAKIEIRERNFSAGRVNFNIETKEGVAPTISGWSSYGNGDDRVNYATVTFASDGKYTFGISVSDEAGNSNSGVNYGNSLTPTSFVIDTTKPEVSVAYDNNASLNGDYYSNFRTAKITVKEHNFDPARVEFAAEATDGGVAVSAPTLSQWYANGDTYTATIVFNRDAKYTWHLTLSDKARNASDKTLDESFVIDTTAPSVTVEGITNESVNISDENIGFVLKVTDTNFDYFKPTLETVVREGNSFVTKTVDGVLTSIRNGQTFTVENLDEDGIYYLSLEAVDKAGNSFMIISYVDEAGNMIEEQVPKAGSITEFSVNREGSVFYLDDATMKIVNGYYVKTVDSDVVIYEVNADALNDNAVILNGEQLVENKQYTIELENDENSWYKYAYILKKDLFENEGDYTIVIQSTDKADRTAYSDVKSLEVSFAVDRTAPLVTLSGLESNGRYQTESQTVTAITTDDGGKIGSFKVTVYNIEKSVVSTPFNMSGDELTKYIEDNNGMIEFEIPEGLRMSVVIECADCATIPTVEGNLTIAEYNNVTVSPNGLLIFWESAKTIVLAAGGATIVGGAGVSTFFIRRRRIKV